jgi:hypothetical protein
MTQLRGLRWMQVAAGATLGLTVLCAHASANKTYYIDEWVDFPGSGQSCSQADLNTVTASLRNAMSADGWSGVRYVDNSAWPQDFWDQNRASGGLDHVYGDTKTVTIYAGHGSPGTIYFGPHNSACTASTTSNMRLGAVPGSGGAKTALAVWLACQVPNVDLLGGETSINNVRQQLGWLNNIGIGDDEPRDVYNKTKSQLNKDAWLWTMNGWGRQPIVVSQTTLSTADACWWYHDHQSWGQDVQDLMSAYAGYRCWEWIE